MNSAQLKPFIFKIGGEAGFGIMTAGLVFSKISTRSGYHVFNYTEYPSLIRGGHNVMQVCVSEEPIYAPYQHTDFLIALNQETVDLHVHELIEGSEILYDHENNIDLSNVPDYVKKFEVPLTQILRDAKGSLVMRNAVALGATLALLGGEMSHLKDLIAEELGHKHEDLIKINHLACDLSYKYVYDHYESDIKNRFSQRPLDAEKIVLTGNEASALGAMAGGMNFASIYPMTPTSNILHTLAPQQEELGFIYKQPEDEISAINMAIGASLAGARAMVATSGGGFCLMAEGYGLAGITETPVVIIEGMRGGPATGLPTWNSQGDLRFILHAHQDDFPRIVLSAGDINEAFEFTSQAFNLAEKYQTPVVVLMDRFLCESHMSTGFFDISDFSIDRGKIVTEFVDGYNRYDLSDDGISPRSIPGVGNHFVANSDEHDAVGYSSEDAQNRIEQMNKRMQKMITCANEDMSNPVVYGPENADLTIVSWSSNKGAVLEALRRHENVNYLHLTWVSPFPTEFVTKVLGNAKKILNIEANYTAQMAGIIREKTGIEIKNHLLKYDGRPIYPEEISKRIEELL